MEEGPVVLRGSDPQWSCMGGTMAGDFEPCLGYLSKPRDVTGDIIQKNMKSAELGPHSPHTTIYGLFLWGL